MLFIYFKEIKLLEIRIQGQGHKNKYGHASLNLSTMPPSKNHLQIKIEIKNRRKRILNDQTKIEMKDLFLFFPFFQMPL